MVDALRSRLGDAIFERVAGADGPRQRDRIHLTPGPRWFPADSAIARVHGDHAMYVGGIRALLVQSMHPVAMKAVSDHSGYRGDMWGRLARTSTFLAVTTFGVDRHAEQAVTAVRTIHDRLDGVTDEGRHYRVSDPHLLAWVHVAEIESFLLAHRVYGRRPLAPAERDEYLAQTAVVARKLGVPDPPTSEAQLRAVLSAYRGELRGTAAAHEAVEVLLRRPDLPGPVRPAYRALASAAIALLPPWMRHELGVGEPRPFLERTVGRAIGGGLVATIRWATAPHQGARHIRD
ncbi:oxygenase MpaB family protein [Pseudactinotalea sp.]|uniref:oxygenase MpaB family protein n=1 Tax=Pseudactinotalea sp. TaxID=1926260 RepID=UPI003B3AAE5E